MEKSSSVYEIWHCPKSGKLFLIPNAAAIIPGGEKIVSSHKKEVFAGLERIKQYETRPDDIIGLLKSELKESILIAKSIYVKLNWVSHLDDIQGVTSTEDSVDPVHFLQDLFVSSFTPELNNLTSMQMEALEKLSEQKSETFFSNKGIPKQLSSFFSEEDQSEIINVVLDRLRSIAGKLDESILQEKENDHPAAWIEVLYKELFADEIKKKKDVNRKRLQNDIDQSIAETLRKRGVTPSADFDKNKK